MPLSYDDGGDEAPNAFRKVVKKLFIGVRLYVTRFLGGEKQRISTTHPRALKTPRIVIYGGMFKRITRVNLRVFEHKYVFLSENNSYLTSKKEEASSYAF